MSRSPGIADGCFTLWSAVSGLLAVMLGVVALTHPAVVAIPGISRMMYVLCVVPPGIALVLVGALGVVRMFSRRPGLELLWWWALALGGAVFFWSQLALFISMASAA